MIKILTVIMKLMTICILVFKGLQPRKCGVGLRDVPRGRGGDPLLHRDRLWHVQDCHQYKRHPLNEGLWRSTSGQFVSLFLRTSWAFTRHHDFHNINMTLWLVSGHHDRPECRVWAVTSSTSARRMERPQGCQMLMMMMIMMMMIMIMIMIRIMMRMMIMMVIVTVAKTNTENADPQVHICAAPTLKSSWEGVLQVSVNKYFV